MTLLSLQQEFNLCALGHFFSATLERFNISSPKYSGILKISDVPQILKIIFNKAMFTCHRSTALQSEFIKIISSTNFNFNACACYFSLFLKEHVFPGYLERNTLKRNLTYSCFIFPLFHEHFSLLGYHVLPTFLKLLVQKK